VREGTWSQRAVEQKIVRCDACEEGLVVSYLRHRPETAIRSTVVRDESVRCPWSACGHEQRVIVPFEGGIVAVTRWLGTRTAVQGCVRHHDLWIAAREYQERAAAVQAADEKRRWRENLRRWMRRLPNRDERS
jgi:hypothetical protein